MASRGSAAGSASALVSRPHPKVVLSPTERDKRINRYLRSAEKKAPKAWTGSAVVHREHAPAYFQYPAMMSPAVQRDLLSLIRRVAPHSASVIDPFCGSGTVLSEAMYAGLECWVSDLNPLAVLICQVKAGVYAPTTLTKRLRTVLMWARSDSSKALATKLPNWRKWFREAAAHQLSRLRRAIRRVRDLESRRFLWVCLAETVRRTSNSRTSTYKLHMRAADDIESVPMPLAVFEEVSALNILKHKQVADHLDELEHLESERYSEQLDVRRQNAGDDFPKTFDILMTSPPYGDNASTVPYGQSAYLPLNWIDLEDIDEGVPAADVLSSTHEIDRVSLGGRRPRWEQVKLLEDLRTRSPSLERLLRRLAKKPHDRTTRILGFVRDLDIVLPKLLRAVKVNGYLVWTVGNRRVGGCQVPLADILRELLCERSAEFVGRCKRSIPQKRMAYRNSFSPTMKDEHLLVFRRVAAKAVASHG